MRLYVDGAEVGSGTPAATLDIRYALQSRRLNLGNYTLASSAPTTRRPGRGCWTRRASMTGAVGRRDRVPPRSRTRDSTEPAGPGPGPVADAHTLPPSARARPREPRARAARHDPPGRRAARRRPRGAAERAGRRRRAAAGLGPQRRRPDRGQLRRRPADAALPHIAVGRRACPSAPSAPPAQARARAVVPGRRGHDLRRRQLDRSIAAPRRAARPGLRLRARERPRRRDRRADPRGEGAPVPPADGEGRRVDGGGLPAPGQARRRHPARRARDHPRPGTRPAGARGQGQRPDPAELGARAQRPLSRGRAGPGQRRRA